MILKHGSLFSGIGGFDLAAEWMGWENVFHCEWNEFGQKILKYYWPNAISYGDITQTDFTIHRGNIDILSGGFPCQPYSMAGKRLGKEDNRHLWPEMLRAIREISPTYIVGENVHGLLSWNGGLVFNEVQTDLENEGYEVQPVILPACGKNAPHKRERIWFVAYSNLQRNNRNERTEGNNVAGKQSENTQQEGNKRTSEINRLAHEWNVANTNGRGLEKRNGKQLAKQEQNQNDKQLCCQREWRDFPTQSPVFSRDDGIPDNMDGITVPKWRKESIKAYGNAIVPQVAHEIFKAISKAGSAKQKKQ